MTEAVEYHVENLSVSVVSAAAVSPDEWRELQLLHKTSLEALPGVEPERVARIVSWDNPTRYRATRMDPAILVDVGLWNPAVFGKVLVSRLFNNDTPISATISHDTSSPPFMRAKLWLSPGWSLPVIGGRRYAHIREMYSHPDIEGELALVGLWHALGERDRRQTMTTYITPGDPADAELITASKTLKLVTTGMQTKQFPGYQSNRVIRVADRVEAVRQRIMQLPGLEPANQNIPIRVV